MPSAGLRKLVAPIPGNPSPYGLLGNCVEIVDITDEHEMNGTEFIPLSCAQAHSWTWCPDPVGQKVFERPGVCSFPPIAVYSGSTCSTFGQSQAEAIQHAREQLRMGEQRALEEAFMAQMCEMAAGNDLTPATGAIPVAQGVAALEGWLAENYGGTGLIHVPAGAAALLGCCNVAVRDSGCPTSLMGNGFVFGAGYNANIGGPGCVQAPAGEAWLFVTPPVRVRRETVLIVPNTEAESIRIQTNDRFVLAERTFVVETACCDAVAMVRVSTCC